MLIPITCGDWPRGNLTYFVDIHHLGKSDRFCIANSGKMHSKKRVLIVEDNPDLSRVLTRVFRKRQLDAVSVRDTNEALMVATKSPPDYAVLDLQLGGVSGMTLIRPLLGINPAMRILVLTGYASIASAVDAIKLGATQYLAKPAHVEEISSALGIDAIVDDDADTVSPLDCSDSARWSLGDLEWKQILGALRDHGGNVSAAARMLGMYRRTLQRKLAARSEAEGKDLLSEIRQKAPFRRNSAVRSVVAK